MRSPLCCAAQLLQVYGYGCEVCIYAVEVGVFYSIRLAIGATVLHKKYVNYYKYGLLLGKLAKNETVVDVRTRTY